MFRRMRGKRSIRLWPMALASNDSAPGWPVHTSIRKCSTCCRHQPFHGHGVIEVSSPLSLYECRAKMAAGY
jgi:hypothetical protein